PVARRSSLRSAAHPSLPSFPTRRSSDLPPRDDERVTVGLEDHRAIAIGQVDPCAGLGEPREHTGIGMTVGVARTDRDHGDRRTRSEEHTSELQSRFDLVCRLLLEKKKKK